MCGSARVGRVEMKMATLDEVYTMDYVEGHHPPSQQTQEWGPNGLLL